MPLIVIAFLLLYVFYAAYSSFRKKKKYKKVPEEWEQMLQEHVGYYQELNEEEQKEFQNRILNFINDKEFVAKKTEIDPLTELLIGASAVIPLFRFPEYKYPGLREVWVFPSTFQMPTQPGGVKQKMFGVVGQGGWLDDKMILSKEALLHGYRHDKDGKNVGIHEFLHLVDKIDGKIDGNPQALVNGTYSYPFLKQVHQEMYRLRRRKSKTNFDTYAATNPSEFFAVAGTYYFENPAKLKSEFPEIYQEMDTLFSQSAQA
jgi:Mlc titration factor MtfA (ptsG expression regulator)